MVGAAMNYLGTEEVAVNFVSVGQWKNLSLGPKQSQKRYSNIPEDEVNTYMANIRTAPHFPFVTPWDYREVTYDTPWMDWDLRQHTTVREHYYPAILVPWQDYVNTLSVQYDSKDFLEYLALIDSATAPPSAVWDVALWVCP